MKIYNHLFYYGYELGLRSKNYRDIPYIIAISVTSACFILNLLSIISLISKMVGYNLTFENHFKYTFGIPVIFCLLIFYLYDGRHLKIYKEIRKTRSRPRTTGKSLKVIFLYFAISISLMIVVVSPLFWE